MKFELPFVFCKSWPFVRRRAEPKIWQPPSKKLFGLCYIDVICHWVSFTFPLDHVIALTNINVEAKNIEFWSKVPASEVPNFLQDVVILRCKDKTELVRLVENIPEKFAEAYGFCGGQLFTSNVEEFK